MNEKNRLLFSSTARRSSKTKTLFLLILLILICSYALAGQGGDASPFRETLKTPPAFVPEFMAEKDNADALYSDEIYAVYATDKAENRFMPAPVSASDMNSTSWTLAVELKGSPVNEAHGNVERHESVGGLVKGNYPF